MRRMRLAVWILFLVNLAVAVVAAAPIYHLLLAFTSSSLTAQELLRGFSLDWFTDLSFNRAGALHRDAVLIGAWGLISIFLNTLLAGGVLGQLREPATPSTLGSFFRETGKYAWRLARLLIVGLVCYWLDFRILNQWLGGEVARWTGAWLDERSVLGARLAAGGLFLAGLVFVNFVMDYAKVQLVMDGKASALEAFFGSLGFALGRFRKALGVYVFPSVCGVVLIGVYAAIVHWLEARHIAPALGEVAGHPLLVIFSLFVLQQLTIFGRYWFRVATWAGEWSYCAEDR